MAEEYTIAKLDAAVDLMCNTPDVMPLLRRCGIDETSQEILRREAAAEGVGARGAQGWVLSEKVQTEYLAAEIVASLASETVTPDPSAVARTQLALSGASSASRVHHIQCLRTALFYLRDVEHILAFDFIRNNAESRYRGDRPTLTRLIVRDILVDVFELRPTLRTVVHHVTGQSVCYVIQKEPRCALVKSLRKMLQMRPESVSLAIPLRASLFGGLPFDIQAKIVSLAATSRCAYLHRFLATKGPDTRAMWFRENFDMCITMCIELYAMHREDAFRFVGEVNGKMMAELRQLKALERIAGDNMPDLTNGLLLGNTLVVCEPKTYRRVLRAARARNLSARMLARPLLLHRALHADIVCVRNRDLAMLNGMCFQRVVSMVSRIQTPNALRVWHRWKLAACDTLPPRPYPLVDYDPHFIDGTFYGPRIKDIGVRVIVCDPK